MLSVVAFTAFSTAIILWLCLGDPKRRRSARLSGKPHNVAIRRLLAAASLVPGLLFAVRGDAAAFLIWFGGCAVAGWLVTLCLSQAQGHIGRESRRPAEQPHGR